MPFRWARVLLLLLTLTHAGHGLRGYRLGFVVGVQAIDLPDQK